MFIFSCPFLHRNANDTERRYHLRYFKTGICTHETDVKGHCLKNGLHCSSGHGANDLRQPVLDSRELQNSDLALERLARLCLSLESERALNDDPKWTGEIDENHDEKCDDVIFFLKIRITFSHITKLNRVNVHRDFVDKVMRVLNITIRVIDVEIRRFSNTSSKKKETKSYFVDFDFFSFRSTPCPHVKQSDEWIDPTVCDAGDSCKCCHTRTEQQFHPEVKMKTTKIFMRKVRLDLQIDEM